MKQRYATFTILCAFAIALLALGCSTATPNPTAASPLTACVITCPHSSVAFRHQHLCASGDRRWFRDITVIGQTAEAWIAGEFDAATRGLKASAEYAKADAELGTCAALIRTLVNAREPDGRGRHPGEDGAGGSTDHR